MRKIIFITLGMLFLLSLSCKLSGTSQQAYIVYTAVDQDGRPLPELVVLNANGKELRRIELPEDKKIGNLYSTFSFSIPKARHTFIPLQGINIWWMLFPAR